MAKEGIVSSTDTSENVGAEETSVKMDEAFESDTEQVETEQLEKDGSAQTEQTAFDWGSYGFPELVGKDAEYVKNHFSFTRRQYGRQANELGELRRRAEELKKLREQVTGKETPAKEIVSEMDDFELQAFANLFNQNPHAAIDKFIKPGLKESLKADLIKELREEFGKTVDEKVGSLATEQEWQAFTARHPDYEPHLDVMRTLMTNEYLSENVPYEEVYKLAVLAKEEASLFSDTCALMAKGLPFEQAKGYAAAKVHQSANADGKKAQVKKEIASAGGGLKRSVSGQKVSEPVITTMDQAFGEED